jgi:Zn-dependent protease with chaperone function
MAMNFFEQQDKARRNTTKLVIIYVLAVIGLILFVWLPVRLILQAQPKVQMSSADHLYLFFMIVVGVCAVIGIGSLFKTLALRAGGPAIAESLGGRALHTGATDPLERRIVNVVEEMAIAAGCPVPAIYLLDDESGINAFAAGFSLDDAAIGITRGCAEQLTRDELQGVVAHEFSHIFNGDMKLNVRLIGILAGITLLSTIGFILFRIGLYSGRGNRKEGGGVGMAILAAGGLLYLGGCLGGLAAALIQAAISRQREFLADSSAVQFTRNPDGIGGALKKIGGFVAGSKIENPHVTETRHMFFSLAMNAAFATHPPIEERINRIDESWAYDQEMREGGAPVVAVAGAAGFAGGGGPSTATPVVVEDPVKVQQPSDVVDQVGLPTAAHVAYARALKERIPADIYEHAHDSYAARAIVYALLLDKQDEKIRELQCGLLDGNTTQDIVRLTRQCASTIHSLPRTLYLPLLEICKAALRNLPKKYYDPFKANIDALVRADKKISLFEWCLQRSLLHHLEVNQSGRFDRGKNRRKLGRLAEPARLLLSSLAYAGHDSPEQAEASFSVAIQQIGRPWTLLPGNECSLKTLGESISALVQLLPRHKEKVVAACVACVTADGKISVKEAELLRVITELLECPLPPLLPTDD